MFIQLPEGSEDRYVELLNDVQHLFIGVATFVIRSRLREEHKPQDFSEELASTCSKAVRNALWANPTTRADAGRIAREVRRRMLHAETFVKPDREDADDEEFIYNVTMLFFTWYTALLDAASGSDPFEKVLDISDFDDDMLPRRLSSDQLSLIDENLSQTVVTPDEFRHFLRDINAARTDGGRLPPQIVEMLTLDGVAVLGLRGSP